jgi:hypothetical protein
VVAHPLIGGRGRWISEFDVCLVYRVSSRTPKAIQRNAVSTPSSQKKKKSPEDSTYLSGFRNADIISNLANVHYSF